MKARIGMCIECQQVKPLANVHFELCDYHNKRRLEAKSGRPKRKRIPYVRRATGEAELFRALWAVRPQYCENCRVPITEAKAENFAHIKPKSTFPELRLTPSNIQILCGECHRLYDQGTREQYEKRKNQIHNAEKS